VRIWDQYGFVEEAGEAVESGGAAYFLYNSTDNIDGRKGVEVFFQIIKTDTGQICTVSSGVTIWVDGPKFARQVTEEALHCACACGKVGTKSSTHPLTGTQDWSLPVSSFPSQGVQVPFALAYSSYTLSDPQSPSAPDFAGLGERNSHFSHGYAQWIDLVRDEHGALAAVWHRGGSALTFKATETGFTSPDGFHFLTAAGSAQTPYPCNGLDPPPTLTVPYGSFTVTDGAGTSYEFNVNAPQGQNHLV
jgi:hypothetical protein